MTAVIKKTNLNDHKTYRRNYFNCSKNMLKGQLLDKLLKRDSANTCDQTDFTFNC